LLNLPADEGGRRDHLAAAFLPWISSPPTLWQVTCFRERRDVNINVKTKIRVNGLEYSSPNELPPELREAYLRATMSGSASLNKCLDKIVLDGQELAINSMPARRVYEDIMSVIENNGHVTLPKFSEPLFTSRQIKVALVVVAAVAAAALAVVKTIS
jgi:hypothetical protein